MIEAGSIIGVDMGGTRLRAAVFDADGMLRVQIARPTPADDPGALLAIIREAAAAAGGPVSKAVVGVPGVIDYRAGTIIALPQLPRWGTAVSAAALAEAMGVSVTLANDADLGALGEYRFGAGRGARDLAYVTCSTGVGAGIVIDGRLLHARYSLAEVGHTIIDWRTGDTVEDFGSGSGIARRTGIDAATLAARAAEGDLAARLVFDEAAQAFAAAVLTLVRCFSPERVVIGGGVSRIGDALVAPVRALLAATPYITLRPEDVVPAELGDAAGLWGALAYAMELRTAER